MISRIIRRTHMYLALLLSPWMLMYALSTMAMNHRSFFRDYYGGPVVAFEKEREQSYDLALGAEVEPRRAAEQILMDLDLEGAFGARKGPAGEIIIQRLDPIFPRRITWSPSDKKLRIEREVFRTPAFLERMHRRRGFQHDFALEDAWAFSVDLVIVAMVFWAASGLWMWWELKGARVLGTVCFASGIIVFSFFVFTI
jgi:hypothetical protein